MMCKVRLLNFFVYVSACVAILAVTSILGAQISDTKAPLARPSRTLYFNRKEQNKESKSETNKPTISAPTNGEKTDYMLQRKLNFSFGEDFKNSQELNDIKRKCSDGSERNVMFFDKSGYLANPEHICYGKRPDVLIAVHTAPDHKDRRDIIRKTYGSMRNIRGWSFQVVFFLGRPSDPMIHKAVQIEADTNQDVVIRNYTDAYRNLTYKHVSVYDWLTQHCDDVQYLVKVDDDVFINVFQIVNYLNAYAIDGFYCSRTVNTKPMRNHGKWAVTKEEYAPGVYPPYCMGYGYMVKASHVRKIYWCTVYSKFFWIDDILVGGLMPKKLGIQMNSFIGGYGLAYMRPSLASHEISNQIFILSLSQKIPPELFEKYWRNSIRYSY